MGTFYRTWDTCHSVEAGSTVAISRTEFRGAFSQDLELQSLEKQLFEAETELSAHLGFAKL